MLVVPVVPTPVVLEVLPGVWPAEFVVVLVVPVPTPGVVVPVAPVVPVLLVVPLLVCAPADVPAVDPALPVCAIATVTAHERIRIERSVSFVCMLPLY